MFHAWLNMFNNYMHGSILVDGVMHPFCTIWNAFFQWGENIDLIKYETFLRIIFVTNISLHNSAYSHVEEVCHT